MIVVGVDGSESSIDALRWAAGQARLTASDLAAVAAWDWPMNFGWTASPLPPDIDLAKDAQDAVDAAVAAVQKDYPDVAIRTHVVQGRPAPVLIEASKGAEMLVVGSRGHGEFAGMLLGSVSEHCVSHAECPVLVLRHTRRD